MDLPDRPVLVVEEIASETVFPTAGTIDLATGNTDHMRPRLKIQLKDSTVIYYSNASYKGTTI